MHVCVPVSGGPMCHPKTYTMLTLQQGECLSSYDVTSLFTSVPIDPALNIIKELLEKDEKFNDRTVFLVQNIIELFGFCLHNTYFSFQNKFYELIEGAPMGSLVSPIVANLCMECFVIKALGSAINPLRAWYRFVDDTWVLQKQAYRYTLKETLQLNKSS